MSTDGPGSGSSSHDGPGPRGVWWEPVTGLIDALQGLEMVARGYSAELEELLVKARTGAGVEEILAVNLTAFRVMLSTAIDDVDSARDRSRASLLKAGLDQGLTLESLAELLTTPVEFLQRVLNEWS